MKAKGILPLFLLGLVLALVALYLPSDVSSEGGSTERVSVDSAGNQGNDRSWDPSISADGRFVAFESWASNLVTGDANDEPDIFVHDRQTGATERVSVDSAGNEANDSSSQAAISGNGRFVAFVSYASNLVPGETNLFHHIFVHDRETGQTQLVSVDSAGNQANDYSYAPTISSDGRFVAFVSEASNLVPGDTNDGFDVFLHDRLTGVTERVSVSSGGEGGNYDSGGYWRSPAISADGRFVAFWSEATNLVPGDTNGFADVFVHDRLTGTTELLSVNSDAIQTDCSSWDPSISSDGRYVAFDSCGSNLVPGDTNDKYDVFVRDRQTHLTSLVSVDIDGGQFSSDGSVSGGYISGDGRFVSFVACRNQCVFEQTRQENVFVHDRQTGQTEEIAEGRGYPGWAAVNADGRFVAFDSKASTLVADDTNDEYDVFVRDRAGGGPTPAPTPTPEPFTYVATGDSVPSGVDLGDEGDDYAHDPEHGRANPEAAYPQYLAGNIVASGVSTDVDLQNIACSGATTREYIDGVRCGASQGKSQLDYVTTSEVAPDLITVTISANDYALTRLYGKCLEPNLESLKSGRLDALRKAAACSEELVKNQDSKNNPNSLTNIGHNLDSILTNLRLTYPEAIIAVTTYYNPAPEEVDNFVCWANRTCRDYFLDPINEILSSTDSLMLQLNREIIKTTIPHFAASGGKVRLVDGLYDEFDGHCGFSFGATITGKVRGKSQSITVHLGCDASESWIAPRDETSGSGNIKKGPIEVTYDFQAGVHPDAEGQQCIANLIWEEVKGQLGSTEAPDPSPCS